MEVQLEGRTLENSPKWQAPDKQTLCFDHSMNMIEDSSIPQIQTSITGEAHGGAPVLGQLGQPNSQRIGIASSTQASAKAYGHA